MFSSNNKLPNLKNTFERNSKKTKNILTAIASISKKILDGWYQYNFTHIWKTKENRKLTEMTPFWSSTTTLIVR